MAIIGLFAGGIIGFTAYVSSAPKFSRNSVAPPGAIDSSICPCGYTDSQTGAHYNFAVDIDFVKNPDFTSQGIFYYLS